MHKLFHVPQNALSMFGSPLHGVKKQNTQLHRVGVYLRKEIKGKKRGETQEVSQNFFNFVLIFRNKYNSRLPKQRLRGVAVQQGIIYHSEKSSLHRRT